MAVTMRPARLRRRLLIQATLADVAGGAQALSELDLADLLRRFGIPEPDRQASRRDQHGRRRWLDAVWEAARLIVEVDGRWHTDVITWWEDMQRDNEFTISGYRVLRFPAHAVRSDPARVAHQIQNALALTPARSNWPPAPRGTDPTRHQQGYGEPPPGAVSLGPGGRPRTVPARPSGPRQLSPRAAGGRPPGRSR